MIVPIFDVDLLKVFEVLVICLLGVYTLFAFIIIRQVNLMTTSFDTEASALFTFVAALHFFAALLLLVFAVVILLIL